MSREIKLEFFKQACAKTETEDSDKIFEQVKHEFDSISADDVADAITQVDQLFQVHKFRFDYGIHFLLDDFALIAQNFNICPATLHYICTVGNEDEATLDDIAEDAKHRSDAMRSGNETPVDHDSLMITKDEYGE